MLRPHPSPMLMGGLQLFTVGASPSAAAVSTPWTGSPEVTNSVTVSQTAGPTSTLSFAWSHVSGDASITVSSPSAATTTFQGTPAEDTSTSAVKRCTVTNGFGQTAHVDVNVSITALHASLNVTTSPSSSVFATLPAGTPYSQGVTCAATGGDGGPYSFNWGFVGGSLSGTTGTANTANMAGQAAGTNLLATITINAADSHSHTGAANLSFHLNWV